MTINTRGQILHGVGAGLAAIDNVAFARGAAGGWVFDDVAVFADQDRAWAIGLYNPTTRQNSRAVFDSADPLYGKGANTLYAGGGVWAAWLAGTGLYASTGFRLEAGGVLGVGPDGAIAYKPDYQALGRSRVRERDGRDYLLTEGHAADLCLLGGGGAIWQERNRLQTRGLPTPLQIGAAWRPQAFLIAGRWWVAYFSDRAGIVVHPVDALEGYVISPAGVDCWHTARQLPTGRVRFALASGEAEQPGQVRAADVDFSQPPTALDRVPGPIVNVPPAPAPAPPVPPTHRPPVIPPAPTPAPSLPPGGGHISEEPSMIAYAPPVPGFKAGDLVDNGNGTVSVKKPNGKFVCITPDGHEEERDSAGGAWESFTKGKASLLAARDGGDRGPQVFVLPLAE